jgi:Ca2+/H+ antiporter
MRAALSLLSILALFFIGHRAQKGIKVSANLYYKRLAKGAINEFLLNQVVYPALIGIAILIIYKIPNIDEYKYMDWLVLSSLVFYILGLFIKQKNRSSIIFKNRDVKGDSDENDYHQNNKNCKIQVLAVIAFFIVVLGMRIGLNAGVAF